MPYCDPNFTAQFKRTGGTSQTRPEIRPQDASRAEADTSCRCVSDRSHPMINDRHSHLIWLAGGVIALLALLPGIVLAQSELATLAGTVIDATGSVVPSVLVT